MQIEKSLFPELEMKEARVIGGGRKSRLWNQIKADILGLPYVKLKREEFGVFGSAILAEYACSMFADMRCTADEFNQVEYITKPDLKNHEFYKSHVEYYADLTTNTCELFIRLNNLI